VIPRSAAGGNLPSSFDPYDEGSPRQTFAHWDVPFITWLEKNGYRVDYCTDLDLHEERDLLTPYHLLLSVGHDEYWSEQMRAHVEAFIRQGGNVAFFSGNTCWWHIEFCDFVKCADDELHPTAFVRDFKWWKKSPENFLTGVSYRNAGGWWAGERDPVGYTVQNAGHWVYEGTGLRDGSTFGRYGIEIDATGPGSPPGTIVLARIPNLLGPGRSAEMTYYETREGAKVFDAGAINFAATATDATEVDLTGKPKLDPVTKKPIVRAPGWIVDGYKNAVTTGLTTAADPITARRAPLTISSHTTLSDPSALRAICGW